MVRRGRLDNQAKVSSDAGPHRRLLNGKFAAVAQQLLIFDAVHDFLGLRDDPARRQRLGRELLEERGLDGRGGKLRRQKPGK